MNLLDWLRGKKKPATGLGQPISKTTAMPPGRTTTNNKLKAAISDYRMKPIIGERDDKETQR